MTEFDKEKLYFTSVAICKEMLEKGVIDNDLYDFFKEQLLRKYSPISEKLYQNVLD